MEAERWRWWPRMWSVEIRSLHWTSSPRGPPLKAALAIPISSVTAPGCTRIWQVQKNIFIINLSTHMQRLGNMLQKHTIQPNTQKPSKYTQCITEICCKCTQHNKCCQIDVSFLKKIFFIICLFGLFTCVLLGSTVLSSLMKELSYGITCDCDVFAFFRFWALHTGMWLKPNFCNHSVCIFLNIFIMWTSAVVFN